MSSSRSNRATRSISERVRLGFWASIGPLSAIGIVTAVAVTAVAWSLWVSAEPQDFDRFMAVSLAAHSANGLAQTIVQFRRWRPPAAKQQRQAGAVRWFGALVLSLVIVVAITDPQTTPARGSPVIYADIGLWALLALAAILVGSLLCAFLIYPAYLAFTAITRDGVKAGWLETSLTSQLSRGEMACIAGVIPLIPVWATAMHLVDPREDNKLLQFSRLFTLEGDIGAIIVAWLSMIIFTVLAIVSLRYRQARLLRTPRSHG